MAKYNLAVTFLTVLRGCPYRARDLAPEDHQVVLYLSLQLALVRQVREILGNHRVLAGGRTVRVNKTLAEQRPFLPASSPLTGSQTVLMSDGFSILL